MIIFSNTFNSITLIWLANIFSAGYCKAENSELNCIIAPEANSQSTGSRKFSMVNKCAKDFTNKDIIDKCEILINRKQIYDEALYRLVISNITNEAYWNEYCATCNNDTVPSTFPIFLSWHPFYREKFGACEQLQARVQRSEVDDIYNLTQIFIREGVKLTAERYNNTPMECSLNGKWPFHLIRRIIPCLYEDLSAGISTRLQKCQYAEKTGKICTRMKFYMDGIIFYFRNNNAIDEYQTVLEYKDFTPGQYYQETSYPGIFYICDEPGTIYEGNHWFKISVNVISMIFIIITVGLNSNKGYFQQNNTNKLLYLYMLGLVLISIILLLIYLSQPVPCVALYLAKFFWVYHFFWSILIFIEFCLAAFGALQNRISDKRNFVYCFFGVIPIAIPIIYYFGVLVVNENYKEDLSQLPTNLPALEYTCPKIPDHLGVFCTSSNVFGSKIYENLLKIVLLPSFYFFIPALFLFISFISLCFFLCYDPAEPLSIPFKDPLIVLTKMSIIMGIHWILLVIHLNHRNDYSSRFLGVSLDTLYQLSIDFHGVIVFLVFGAKRCVGLGMKMFGGEYESDSRQNRNNDMEIS